MSALRSVLIANRGEIAVRVIRACQQLGIEAIAVYSTADAEALHVKLADRAICIGPPHPLKSYLNPSAIISAAKLSDAEAIHPGYGFLAENADFAALCGEHEIIFIGPSAEVIRQMGEKVGARTLMSEIGLPVLPGSEVIATPKQLASEAQRIGLPLIIKAVGGGGGRGMKIVARPPDLPNAWQTARREAGAAFGNDAVYLERFIEKPRHIEVQVAIDNYGNGIYLGARECSIQRRHQKLIEEAPSPLFDAEDQEALCSNALQAAMAVGYRSLGTIEFLVDDEGECYFIEMNTRIQVEHTVSEMVTGIDMVQLQLRMAGGERLTLAQDAVCFRGHAIECRINAEDPETRVGSAGTVSELHLPSGFGVRVDSALYPGCKVPPFYDSLIAKLVAWGDDRESAIARMLQALAETRIEGVQTNRGLHQQLLQDAAFVRGEYDVSLLSAWPYAEAPQAANPANGNGPRRQQGGPGKRRQPPPAGATAAADKRPARPVASKGRRPPGGG
ncbi:MAG: acetyl-CoA carboxylase biotin carboxylase subunit [Deltaproteobacteria bacterium]|nr:acetyl-CoA carboxylase biotin carboxylase subunit [Deltaproteobacteria bacterium]